MSKTQIAAVTTGNTGSNAQVHVPAQDSCSSSTSGPSVTRKPVEGDGLGGVCLCFVLVILEYLAHLYAAEQAALVLYWVNASFLDPPK